MKSVAVLALLWLILLATDAFAWEAAKVDLNPMFSPDGRMVAFERQDHGSGVSEVVLMDLRSRRARTIVGPLWRIRSGGRGALVGVNELSASVIRTDGRVLSTIWGKGAGYPYVPMDAHVHPRFANPCWRHERLCFDTHDAPYIRKHVRAWDFDPRTLGIRLLSVSQEKPPKAALAARPVQSIEGTFAVDEDGRLFCTSPGKRRLVRIESAYVGAISPDGRYVVVTSDEPSAPEFAGIYLLRADGGGLTRLAQGYASHFIWHPSGRWIAYRTFRGELVRVSRNGAGRRVLAGGVPEEAQIRWSSDGRRVLIAHRSGRSVAWRVLYPGSLRGRKVTPAIRVPSGGRVSLSPDGRLAAWMWVHPARHEGELRVMGRGGRCRLRVKPVSMEAVGSLTAGWSGDSRRLAVSLHGSIRLVDTSTWRYRTLTGELY